MRAIPMTSLAAVLLAGPAGAGVVFEIETTDHDSSPPRVESTEVAAEGGNLKMSVDPSEEGGRPGEAIFRGDRREMVIVDHDEKSYAVIDHETIQQIADMASQMSAQIAEALKNVPPAQREAVEKMMKQRMPAQPPKPVPTVVRNTGESAELHGYPCVKYEVTHAGRVVRELWVTPWSRVEGGAEAAEAFQAMGSFFQEMRDALPAGGVPGGQGDSVMADLSEIDGFPVVTRELADDGSIESESVLRSSRRRTLDPDAFEPPAGYKRRQMFSP